MIQLLVVDDSPTQVAAITEIFKSRGREIQVSSVSNGEDCLRKMGRTRFSVVLLDYVLPDMNGLEVLAAIRENGWSVPVIIITGQGDEKTAVEAMKSGAADYITKSSDFLNIIPVVVDQTLEKEALKIRLSEAEDRLRDLHRISLDISLEINLDRLAERLISGIQHLTKSDLAVVLFQSPDDKKTQVFSVSGIELGKKSPEEKLKEMGIWESFVKPRSPAHFQFKDKPSSKASSKHPKSGQARCAFVVPLFIHDKIIGRLLVARPQADLNYTPEDQEVLINLGIHASTAIENAQYVKRTELQAVTDSLTGLYNHREFHRRLDQEIERANRYGRRLSILMMDIDHFKSLNDTYGHPFGDEILKSISQKIKKRLRTVDIPARYGGEEFSVILPETSAEKALLVAERIRTDIFQAVFTMEETPVKATISIGTASLDHFRDRQSLVSAADKALYISKETGRNRVCQYEPDFEKIMEKGELPVEEVRMGMLRKLSTAVEGRSPYLRGQSERVAHLTLDLARQMKLPNDEIEGLRQAALLHNTGLAHISGDLLNKKGPLSVEEQTVIRGHPIMAEMILREATNLQNILPAILYHHERFDGMGYPTGMKGARIPLSARILAVTSSYMAMISERPHREKASEKEARQMVEKNSGTQFDPDVVEAFLSLLGKNGKKK